MRTESMLKKLLKFISVDQFSSNQQVLKKIDPLNDNFKKSLDFNYKNWVLEQKWMEENWGWNYFCFYYQIS